MKLRATFLTASIVIVSACSSTQKIKSETIETKNFELKDFSAIHVAEGVTVTLYKSFEHRATASSNFIDYVNLSVDNDGVLVVDMNNNHKTKLVKPKTSIEIWAKNVHQFKASSNATLNVEDNFNQDEQHIYTSSNGKVVYDVSCDVLRLEASSNGNITGDIKIKDLYATASSNADIQLKGETTNAYLQATSSADIEAKKVKANYVEAKSASNADIYITVLEKLKGSVSGNGDLHYKTNDNNISIEVEKSSGGSVEEIKGIF